MSDETENQPFVLRLPLHMFVEKIGQVSIRLATNDDCSSVTKLFVSVLAEHGLQPDFQTTDSDLRDIEASYLKNGGLFEIVEDEESNILGSLGLFPIDERTCELRKMYFIPRVRGFGLGKRVLELVVAQARELGFKKIILETSSKLIAANRLYTSFGFTPLASDHLAARADQAYKLDL
jgi:putative acetyltransferase